MKNISVMSNITKEQSKKLQYLNKHFCCPKVSGLSTIIINLRTKMSTEEITTFDLNEFYDILMSVTIKDKLKPFVRQFKKQNIPFIYQTIVNLLQVLTSKKQIPLMKFNALMATKLFFDTGQYVPIVFIQIYLLPLIYEIASYRIQKRSQEGLTLYFIQKGYDSTKEMKRIGFNFVLLALEFSFMSAQVKPYRNIENQQLDEASNFSRLAKMLLEKGVQPIESYKFYLPSYVNQTRKRFLKKLSKFNPDDYVDFCLKLTCDEINLNKKPELDLKKMIAYGDAFYTIPLMNICEDELCAMETNFVNKKKYLILLGEFMKSGDIYAVLIITRSTFLETIYDRIQSVKGEAGLDAGQQIYPEVEAAKGEKRQFYIEFLKHIEIWAFCHPLDQDGEPTDAKKIFDVLKIQRKFVFPPNILLSKIRTQMETNLKMNNCRNEKLIKLVDDLSSYESRKRASLEMRESRTSRKSQRNKGSILNSYIEFDEMEEMVINAKKKMELICQSQKLPQTIAALKKFKKFWETMEEKNEIDADQSDDIEIVIQQGTLCCGMIQILLPVYHQYSKGAISWSEYLDKVNLLMKSEGEEEEGEVSLAKNIEMSSIKQSESKVEHFSSENSHSAYLRSETKGNEKKSQLISSQYEDNIGQSDMKIAIQSKQGFNDYQVAFGQPKQDNFNKKRRGFQKKQSSLRQSFNDSAGSSRRSSGSKHSSSNILQRRAINSKNSSNMSKPSEQEPQYKNILTVGKRLKEEHNLNKAQESGQSFISSEHSSLKQNKIKSKLSSNRGNHSNLQSESGQNRDSKLKSASIEDYYGHESIQKNSQVGFQSNSSSSKLKIQGRIKGSSKVQKKQTNPFLIQRQNANHSEVHSYDQNTFQIQTENKESPSNKESQLIYQNQSSRFTFTSKEDRKQLNQAPLSILSKYEIEESNIEEPQLKPQIHSFHEALEEEKVTNPSKISTFKDCFDVNNEIISQEGSERMFKFSRGKIVNFIETVYSKQTPKNSSIVDMLSQRNARQTIESYRNERQKYREAQTQSQKAKSLQSFNKNMRMKFFLKRQQQQQTEQKVEVRSPQNNQSQHVSFYQSSECSFRKSEANLNLRLVSRQFLGSEPVAQNRVINTNIYNHYFTESKNDRMRKCMLKSKCLLIKNDQFQIGYVSTRKQNQISITLFITPLKDKIQEVNLLLAQDQNVSIKLSANYIQQIKINSQQYITLLVSVDNVPYVLPSLNLKFKRNKKYSHNQMLITIPASFNKFVDFHKLGGDISHPYKNQNANQDKIIIEEFRYSSKILSGDKIKQNLNQFSLVENEKHYSVYASEVYFRGKIYLLRLNVKNGGKMSIEGINMTGDHRNTKYLQFLMTTFHCIFQSSKSSK